MKFTSENCPELKKVVDIKCADHKSYFKRYKPLSDTEAELEWCILKDAEYGSTHIGMPLTHAKILLQLIRESKS